MINEKNNGCWVKGFVGKDSVKIYTSKRGFPYGQFLLRSKKSEDNWQSYKVYCSENVAKGMIEAGYGTEKKRKSLLKIEGEMDNEYSVGSDGVGKVSFTIRNAQVYECNLTSASFIKPMTSTPKGDTETDFAAVKKVCLSGEKVTDEDLFG